MAKIDGFLTEHREDAARRDPKQRKLDNREFVLPLTDDQVHRQSSRCMDCGVPFCHQGCPLGNLIPDFNEAVYENRWKDAYHILSETNDFPEFTGRICPAPCESSCVLSINRDAVTIEEIEKTIIERAFDQGWVKPQLPKRRTGKRVAIVGSGPAGLAAATMLNRMGHAVTVLEKDDRLGGLLRYGIPDFKLEKKVIDRRIAIMKAEGIIFQTQTEVGSEAYPVERLNAEYDAILIATGATVARDLPIEGRNAQGIHFAMDYLTRHNRHVAGDELPTDASLDARGKHVLVIGGGDTGSDCVGTANRQGAASVSQLQYRPAPGNQRPTDNLWPEAPMILSESSSHQEGCERQWSVLTKGFVINQQGQVQGLRIVELEWINPASREYREKPGSMRTLPCDLALIAIGYQHPTHKGLIEQLGLQLTTAGMIKAGSQMQTSLPGVFVAGDAQRGQSLVVWALADGRRAAESIHTYLTQKPENPASKSLSQAMSDATQLLARLH